jgi:hypothetical protein
MQPGGDAVTWVDRDAIAQGTLAMLRVNMGIQPGERLLILADVPTSQQWESSTPGDVEVMLRRAYLARLVAEVA